MKSVRLTQKYRGKLPGVVISVDPKHGARLVRAGFAVEAETNPKTEQRRAGRESRARKKPGTQG
jgi:hypothetical protein